MIRERAEGEPSRLESVAERDRTFAKRLCTLDLLNHLLLLHRRIDVLATIDRRGRFAYKDFFLPDPQKIVTHMPTELVRLLTVDAEYLRVTTDEKTLTVFNEGNGRGVFVAPDQQPQGHPFINTFRMDSRGRMYWLRDDYSNALIADSYSVEEAYDDATTLMQAVSVQATETGVSYRNEQVRIHWTEIIR